MKIWQSYGSGHLARISVVGRFKTIESAALAERALQDFVNAAWESVMKASRSASTKGGAILVI
jgi:hypothetical protein